MALQARLLALLSPSGDDEQVRRPSVIACSAGPLSRVGPGLEVEGVGALKLPLAPGQLAALAAAGEAAAGGPEPQPGVTVIPASRLATINPRWEGEVVPEAVRRATAALNFGCGVGTACVEARLSRLVVLEEGARLQPTVFPASDPTTTFAHLAILLPSAYAGGQLEAAHEGTAVTADLAARNRASSCFAAFYSGCTLSAQPASGGPRALLLYDLLHTGGQPPPRLPDREQRLVDLAREWDGAGGAAAPKQLCFLLENRYDADDLRERGLEALSGADKAAAQLLVAACRRGAPLDVQLALVKAKAAPGLKRWQVLDRVMREHGGFLCGSCGGFHFEDDADEPYARQQAQAAWARFVHGNEGLNAPSLLKWQDAKAAKFVPLAGEAPAFAATALHPTRELLHRPGYWQRAPNLVLGFDEEDEDEGEEEESTPLSQFRLVGLLVSPRSRRLQNAAHACPSGQAEPAAEGAAPLAAAPAAEAVQKLEGLWSLRASIVGSGWREDEVDFGVDEYLSEAGYDSEEGGEAGESGGLLLRGGCPTDLQVPSGPAATAAQLAQALVGCLEEPPLARGMLSGELQLHALVLLIHSTLQLGDTPLAMRLLRCAAARSSTHAAQLPRAVVALLRQHGWPDEARAALRSWARADDRLSVDSGIALVQALADAGAAEGAGGAHEAAAVVALRVAEELRRASNARPLRHLFKYPVPPLQALLSVKTAGGRLALEAAVDALLQRYGTTAPLELPAVDMAWRPLSFAHLQAACVRLMEALPPHAIAGSPPLLKLVCTCLEQLTSRMGPPPSAPEDWSKLGFGAVGDCYPRCLQCQEVQAFLSDPQRREATFAQTDCLERWVNNTLLSGFGRSAPPFCDVAAVREEGDAGGERWRFTKSHKQFEEKAAAHARLVAQQRALITLLVPCLQLLLTGAAAGRGSSSEEGALPPAKAARMC